jgi:hypothetical protein
MFGVGDSTDGGAPFVVDDRPYTVFTEMRVVMMTNSTSATQSKQAGAAHRAIAGRISGRATNTTAPARDSVPYNFGINDPVPFGG